MLPTFTNQTITPLIRVHFADPASTVTSTQTDPLIGGTGEGLGRYRVSGKARVQSKEADWSFVLKVLSPISGGTTITDWNYWRREAHVYESDLLTTLPGPLQTPRCYGVQDQADGSCWIWLEDLGRPTEDAWTAETYWHAGHHLGQLNGHYLTTQELPAYPWLNRMFLPHWLDRVPGMTRLDEALAHPLVQRLYPRDVLDGYHRLWATRARWLSTLAQLPHTFCHLDAFPGNLFVRPTAIGGGTFVAIDWAYAGINAIGAELAALTFAEVTLFKRIDLATARSNAAAAWDGYLSGLAAVGWHGESKMVCIGYLATALLRFGVGMVPVSINVVIDPLIHEWAEPVYGSPIAGMIDYWVEVARWRLELMRELMDL
ncbi:MAG TPA: phosphotransferase [Caldilineaceae bacterium]|nr:phosphotransferase [Caldilineaceae bacterium]